MSMEGKGIVIRRSRISYLYNYLLIGLVAFLFVLSWFGLDLTFSFSPQTYEAFWKSFVVLSFASVIAFLFGEAEIDRWFRYYLITNSEVILTEGILRKNRIIIHYQSISNVDVYKGIPGRIFNFGDLTVVGFKNQVLMRGIRDPEVFYRIINNKIAIMQGTKEVVAHERIRPKKKPKKRKGWQEQEEALRKELEKRGIKVREKKEKGGKKRRKLSLKRLHRRKPSEKQETESEE